MTFNVAAIPSAQFIGAPVPFPTKLGTVLKQIPRVYSLFFNWQNYGVSNSNNQIAVPINLAQNNQSAQLDAIRGVYIDNTGSDAAIYVYFPDTGCTVTCAQFSTNWQPVLTNVLQCVVIGKGFVTGDQSQTTIFLTNETIPPGESAEVEYSYPQYLASPRISRGVNQFTTGFNSPAIGDQWQLVNYNFGSITTTTTPLFGSPYTAGGFITLTDLYISVTNNSGAQGGGTGSIIVKSTGASGVLFGPVGGTPSGILTDMHGMQIKLNAGETWEIQSTITAANANALLNAFFGFQYSGSGIAETLFNFGNIGSPVSNSYQLGSSGNHVFGGVQFTAPQSGSVLSVTVGIAGNNGGTFAVSAAIYSDNAGSPGSLIATTLATNVSNTTSLFEFDFPTPLPQIVSGTKYWIVFPNVSLNVSGHTFNVQATNTISNLNGSGTAATIAGVAINSGIINAGDTFIVRVNCQQP